MTRTFLVEVGVDDATPDSLLLDADQINETLSDAGWDVISVKPWASPQQAGPVSLPPQLPPTLG